MKTPFGGCYTNGNKRLTRNALYELERCDWPGNVRELANVIEVAAMLASGKDIGVEDLPIRANAARQSMMKSLPEMEKEHITQALALCDGNKRKSSEIMGISLRNLYRKIERYNIKLPKA